MHIDYHTSGVFANGVGAGRAPYYGVSASPTVLTDGQNAVVGAGDSVSVYNTYIGLVNTSFADLSKLLIDCEVDFNATTEMANATVTVTVAPGETIGSPENCSVRMAVYEDNVFQCCEPRSLKATWGYIARDCPLEVVLNSDINTTPQVETFSFALTGGYDISEMGAIAFVQRNTNRKVLQSAHSQLQYSLDVVDNDNLVTKVEDTTAEFSTTVTYTGTVADDVVVSIASGLPVGWTTELVAGALSSTTGSLTIPGMTNGQVENVLVRITPGGARAAAGLGSVAVTTEPATNGTFGSSTTYHVFNNTPAILVVNDDNGDDNDAELQLQAAVANSGNFSLLRDVDAEGNPAESDLLGFDAVLWSTGSVQGGTIGGNNQTKLINYLNTGGKLFLMSHGYLNHQGLTTFTTDYLRVSAFSQDAQAITATGSTGGIADGVSYTLGGPFPDFSDTITPNTGGVVFLEGSNGDIGVHYDNGTFQTAFVSSAIELATNPGDEDLIDAVLEWFFPSGTTDVRPGIAANGLELRQNAPNPFRVGTNLAFAVPTEGVVNLSVYNVAGQKVVDLVNRPMAAGSHSVAWDGRDASGLPVASGVYLYRLEAGGETLTKEMVLLK